MPRLETITRIPSEAQELLEAVGYLDVSDLIEADIDHLLSELRRANKTLEILSDGLTKNAVRQWQQWAREGRQADEATTKGQASTAKKQPAKSAGKQPKAKLVNLEKDESMMEMLSLSPTAEPLDSMLLAEEGISMDDLEEGVLLNKCDSKLKINIMTTLGRADAVVRQDEVSRVGLNSSRIRNFDDLDSSMQYVKPLERGAAQAAIAASDGLNEGVDPKSRKFIKGVFHGDARTVRIAATAFIIFAAILVMNIVSLLGLFIFRTRLEPSFVVGWVAGLLFLLLIAAGLYFYFASKAKCVVCRQPSLMIKKCVKHKKAHHVKGLGYILPTAMQLLSHQWFYCTYCGTAIRLKK
ncbi:MAG: hypothetical protein ACPH2J_02985 [Akkermansiaceae bacterium]